MRLSHLVFVCLLLLAACEPRKEPPKPPAADPKAAAPVVAALCQPRAAAFPPPSKLADWAQGAQLFDDLGDFSRKVTTASPEAQRWFDQGMRYVWSFNHDEATRAFVKAAQVDPQCASCYWGAALTMGPNYNVPMLPDRAQAAWDALEKAKELAPKATPVEQALIGALGKRYGGPQPLDPPAMQPFQEAYAKAMSEVAQKFPADDDVQTLAAESRMNTNPWHLWSLDGKAAPGTREIVAALEKVLARNPQHPGANHYYIHAMEASPHPEKAVASAERVGAMMKGAGHLVHMPAHIFQRVGRYADAAAANRAGAGADLAYMKKVSPQGYYPIYLAHNYDFLAFSAAMQGRSAEALEAARSTVQAAPPELLDAIPGMDFFVAKIYLVELRFGRWDEMLKEPVPPEKYAVQTGFYRFAHAYALAAKGQLDEAAKARGELDTYIGRLPPDLLAGYSSARDVLTLALGTLDARIAQGRGQGAEAIKALQQAVALEDKLAYDEPADWFFPARHLLGAALLQAGKAKDAEAVYREDLRRNPENGWSLFGLAQALKAQKKDAAQVETRLAAAWKEADIQLSASAI
ncbi:MAG TPA: hypothetical protein VM074_01220 [Solimonas sp.]|nr:hypothetical protein [Solimonas sp.]